MNMRRVKKVIVVYNKGSRGKTTVLRMLCQKLLQGKSSTDYTIIREGAESEILNPPNGVQPNRPDVMLAVHHDGKLVGVGTAGDIWDVVWRNFMFFDQVYPNEKFDVVFIAIREQHRREEIGDCGRSFPLMALEELECHYGLDCVQRPFERTTVVAKGYGGSRLAFQNQCQSVNQQLANKLRGLI